MPAKYEPTQLAPDQYRAMLQLDAKVGRAPIESSLQGLISIRASQLNNCAYCIDMHSKDARAAGETEQRIYGLVAWRATTYYTSREQAALALTEALTLPPVHEAIVAARRACEDAFTEEELTAVVFTIATIKAWNVLGVGLDYEAGSYEAQAAAA